MCFSPEASFTAGAVTAAAGIFALARAQGWTERPFAALPLCFSAQQFGEGLLWTQLPSDAGWVESATRLFLVMAHAFWPAYAPCAAFALEPQRDRRILMAPFVLVGWILSAYLLVELDRNTLAACVVDGHINYHLGTRPSLTWPIYIGATVAPFLLSSQPWVVRFGLIVLAGAAFAAAAYFEWFLSVWCFFAALASVMVILHFARSRAGSTAGAVTQSTG